MFIDSSTFENNAIAVRCMIVWHNNVEKAINILDYKSIWLVEVLSYKYYAIFNLFL